MSIAPRDLEPPDARDEQDDRPDAREASDPSNAAPHDDPELEGPRTDNDADGEATDLSYASPGRQP